MRRALPLLVAGASLLACGGTGERGTPVPLSVTETLGGGDTAGFARAIEPRSFEFPADHGPHPDFRSEWWYVTGNLEAAEGKEFGFQLTFFRNALSPRPPETASAWSTNQAYMAHFAVTDVAEGKFHAFERIARGAAGLAGAVANPLAVWVADWRLTSVGRETFPLGLEASGPGVSIRLELSPGKPPIAQGERGLSQKGPEAGNASYYYSYTRLPTQGTLVLGRDTLSVRGSAWLDREWSTSALSEGVVGWDWFALQLSDGWDLMMYRLRRTDGAATGESAAVLVDPAGRSIPLGWDRDLSLSDTGSWRSARDGTLYPSGWRVTLPERGWDLFVEPRVQDQELELSFRYWEGAVSVRGSGEGGAPVEGHGYAELTGYAGSLPDR